MIKVVLRRISRGNYVGDTVLSRLADYARMDVDDVLTSLGTDRDGLTVEEAERRLKMYGPNELVHERPPRWYVQLVRAFTSPFTGILTLIAAVSYLTDVLFAPPGKMNWGTIIIISVIILISGLLSFIQEYRSNIEVEKLKTIVQTKAAVKRKEMGLREIDIGEIVPGDIVQLSAGDIVPADMRIITSRDFFVDMAVLTGESEPVEKRPSLSGERRMAERLTISDLENICFMGTSVISGSATGVVVATGENTYLGSMAKRIAGQKTVTGFERGVYEVSKLFIKLMAAMVPVVFTLNWLTKGDWINSLLFALAIAVGLTPELLPMIVTVNLAKGAVAMAKRESIVKRLDAIQNFGAMDILCTDKTGTLTVGKVVLMKYLDINGREYGRVLEYAFLNSYYQTGLRNHLDMAILAFGEERGIKTSELEKVYRKVDEIPFDFVRRRMSVVVESQDGANGGRHLISKGAVEEILLICDRVEFDGEVVPLTGQLKSKALDMVRRLNEEGMRVLAVARKDDVPPEGVFSSADERDMILVGFLAFLDPPKDTAPQAIRDLKELGVEVKILTGDSDIVAREVSERVGIPARNILSGEDIEEITDEELTEIAEKTTIFARITPIQKMRIIRALRRRGGRIVGFLGDGVNDAPAMKEADVAISVDNAVDIARESADIVLLRKSLRVLRDGVVKGREIFGNIVKYIAITASSNFGNVLSILVASSFLPFLPMTPLQILLLNLTYDISMALTPLDRVDDEYLKKPRRWDAAKIRRFMIWFGPISSIFDITTYALMYFLIGPMTIGGPYRFLPEKLKSEFVSLFQTGWFVESLWTQTMVVHTLRTEKVPFIQSRPAWPLLLSTLTAAVGGAILPFTPIGPLLGLRPMPPIYFVIVLIPAVLAYLILTQYVKAMFMRRYGSLF